MKRVEINNVSGLDSDIGTAAFYEDGKCGYLRKIVIDPGSDQVASLIVKQDLIIQQQRVIPIDGSRKPKKMKSSFPSNSPNINKLTV